MNTATNDLTEVTFINPSNKEAFTVPFLTLSPHRLGILAGIRKRYPEPSDMVLQLIGMADADPTLAVVTQLLTGDETEKEKILSTLRLYTNEESDKEAVKRLLTSTIESETKYSSIESRMNSAREYVIAMTDRKDFPKNIKFDVEKNTYSNEFWEAQKPKAVLELGKFFRRTIDECLS